MFAKEVFHRAIKNYERRKIRTFEMKMSGCQQTHHVVNMSVDVKIALLQIISKFILCILQKTY